MNINIELLIIVIVSYIIMTYLYLKLYNWQITKRLKTRKGLRLPSPVFTAITLLVVLSLSTAILTKNEQQVLIVKFTNNHIENQIDSDGIVDESNESDRFAASRCISDTAFEESEEFQYPTYGLVSVYYGWYRPFGKLNFHYGIDITNKIDTTIYAAASGKITYKGYNKYGGYKIEIDHLNGYKTIYAHLNSFAEEVEEGYYIKKGCTIGTMGKSGMSTGTHLHFEVHKDEERLNPLKVIGVEWPTSKEKLDWVSFSLHEMLFNLQLSWCI